jgi:hypothetical protein
LVARFARTRCSGALGIPRRGFGCGQQDPVEVGLDYLEHKRGKQGVRKVREAELEEKVHKRIKRRSWLTGVW